MLTIIVVGATAATATGVGAQLHHTKTSNLIKQKLTQKQKTHQSLALKNT